MNTATVNADPTELAKFSDLAHKWWELDGEFKPLHRINPLRLDWMNQQASFKNKKILDVGCGGGILSDSMARLGAQVTGIDLATKALKVAKLHALEASTPNVSYEEISAEAKAEQAPGSFDVVTCMEMLEHVPNPASVVKACAQLVKPGGWVFFSTINRNPKAYISAILGAEYLLKIVPQGTHDFQKFIKPSELAYFIRAAGLDLKTSKGLQYNPITDRFWLNEDTSVNYMVGTQRPIIE